MSVFILTYLDVIVFSLSSDEAQILVGVCVVNCELKCSDAPAGEVLHLLLLLLLLLCSAIFIFPRMAALTFSTEELTVFRDSRGSAVLLCPVRKRCHERKVMSVSPGCLLNLRHHYFSTQHDCIHIIPHPAKVAAHHLSGDLALGGPGEGGWV